MAYTFKIKNIFITANYYGALTNKRKCFFFGPPWQVLNFTWISIYFYISKIFLQKLYPYPSVFEDITKELGGEPYNKVGNYECSRF